MPGNVPSLRSLALMPSTSSAVDACAVNKTSGLDELAVIGGGGDLAFFGLASVRRGGRLPPSFVTTELLLPAALRKAQDFSFVERPQRAYCVPYHTSEELTDH